MAKESEAIGRAGREAATLPVWKSGDNAFAGVVFVLPVVNRDEGERHAAGIARLLL